MVSWVRCGAGLYRYLIFVTFLTEECGSEWFLGYEGFKTLLGVDMSLGQLISCKTLCEYIIYLRNKETQQTLQVIINIQYDASF